MANDRCCLDCGQAQSTWTSHGRRGLCEKCHYQRKKHGRELPPLQRVSFEQRLASMDHPEGECWPWTGYVNKYGYGGLGVSNTHGAANAHVRSYTHHKGPVPPGFEVGHACHDQDLSCRKVQKCPHRACVNPDHLVLQTRSENLRARHLSDRCKRGLHEMTGGNVRFRSGWRRCKACEHKTRRERYARRRAMGATSAEAR